MQTKMPRFQLAHRGSLFVQSAHLLLCGSLSKERRMLTGCRVRRALAASSAPTMLICRGFILSLACRHLMVVLKERWPFDDNDQVMKIYAAVAALLGVSAALVYAPRTLRNHLHSDSAISTSEQYESRWYENNVDHYDKNDTRVSIRLCPIAPLKLSRHSVNGIG